MLTHESRQLPSWLIFDVRQMKRRKFTILLACLALMFPVFLVARHVTMRAGAAQWYFDRDSGTTFYVESDRRHVVAIGPSGRRLWRRDPFVDAKLQPYRVAHSLIHWIGRPTVDYSATVKERYVGLGFDSSQGGLLLVRNGDFLWLGQD